MIKYNLRKESHRNAEVQNVWARLFTSTLYRNNLCTVVDNHSEVENHRYTDKPALLLIHLTPQVRKYEYAKLFDEFLYVGVYPWETQPTYTNWPYTYEEISLEQASLTLFDILYNVEPYLKTATLAGGSRDELLDECNTYTGYYVLNDEEDYKIERNGLNVIFYKMAEDKPIEIYKGQLDETRFKKALLKFRAKQEICQKVDMLLANGELGKKVKEFELL